MTRLNAIVFFATACLVVLAVAAINVFCEYVDLNSTVIIDRAAEFQAGGQGLISIPDDLELRFKLELLRRRSPPIEAAIFGSSMVLGLQPEFFSKSSTWMNMAVNGNTLYSSLGEAREALKTSTVRSVFISLDWGLGFPFAVGTFDPEMRRRHPALLDLLRDVLSTSRTEQSIANLLDTAFDRRASFLLGGVSNCASGETALTLDPNVPGCYGNRADGSTIFLDNRRKGLSVAPITPAAATRLLDDRTVAETEYYKTLVAYKADVPVNNYLDLEQIASITRARSGRTVLILPPMLPGLVTVIEADSVAGPLLGHFKQTISAWSSEHGIEVIDMNKSEVFGCLPNDFADGHHPLTSCWIKVANAMHGELKAGPAER